MGNFGKLAAALEASSIDLSSGEFTLLAPSDSAFEKHEKEVGTPITDDILKYHIIPSKVSMDGLTVDQPTLQGGTLTSYRKFRKNWLDNAIIGLKSEGPSNSSNWPADVAPTTASSTPLTRSSCRAPTPSGKRSLPGACRRSRRCSPLALRLALYFTRLFARGAGPQGVVIIHG